LFWLHVTEQLLVNHLFRTCFESLNLHVKRLNNILPKKLLDSEGNDDNVFQTAIISTAAIDAGVSQVASKLNI